MKIIEEILEEPKNNFLTVITGNGKTDLYILEGFANKFNGLEKIIWNPRRILKTRESGLKALNVLRVLISKYKLKNFLYLVDREHVKDHEDIRRYLNKEVQMRNLSIDEYIIHGNYGSHYVKIYAVIFGKNKNIEEEIADLIKELYGENIKPEKKEIKNFLKKQGIWYSELIEKANKKQLNNAFPNLTKVIERIEMEDIVDNL